MTKQEIWKLATDKPKSVRVILERHHTESFNEIINYIDVPTFSEKLYLYVHGLDKRGVCPISGKFTKFKSYRSGYNKYNSSREMGIAKTIKTSKTIKCENCGKGLTVYKKSNQKFCSVKCSNRYYSKNIEAKERKLNKMKKTTLEKYGVDNVNKLKEFRDKIKSTNMIRYGTEHAIQSKEVLDNMKSNNIKKYGVESTNSLQSVKDKKMKSFNEKYGGVLHGSSEISNKIISTLKSKYGVDNINKLPESKERLSKNAQLGISGFKSPGFKDYLKSNNIENVSQIPDIANKIRKKHKKTYYEYMVKSLKKRHIKPLFTFKEYIGTYNQIWVDYKFECLDCNYQFESRLGCGEFPYCKKCNPTLNRSKPQFELEEYIKSIYTGKIKVNDRTAIKPYEIDLLLPDLKLGIEFNGIYYHTEINGGKDKGYHLMKTEMANNQGIRLLHITDSEWFFKRDIVKSILDNIINKPNIKIYANKTKLIEVDSETSRLFLENNHLQGKDNSKIRLGLYYGEELVSLMTFGKSRYGKDAEYEIYRFCNKLNTSVIGGAEKIFKNFIRLYKPNTIKTFSDRRYFTGDIYEKLGFTFIENTSPNYFYTKNYRDLESRRKYQKKQLPKLLETFDPDKTEFQNMVENGYDRIWDCGNMKFIWETE